MVKNSGGPGLLGEEPSQQIPDDLRRLKQLLETSERSMTTSRPGNDDRRSHWVVTAPFGAIVEGDAVK